MFRLTLNFAGKPVRKYNFDQDMVCIGRDPDCEILIDNIGVSRRHATIEKANGEYILTDLKSHNGTFVRGQRIYHHQLGEGDEFFIGKYSLSFENLDVQAPAAETPKEKVEKTVTGMQDMTFRLDKNEIERIMGASTTGSMPKLAILSPEKEQRTILLDQPFCLIGAQENAALPIHGFRMPLVAAVLVRNDKWFHLVSTSKVPVKVNGQRVADHQLADGELFQIGKYKFRFATN